MDEQREFEIVGTVVLRATVRVTAGSVEEAREIAAYAIAEDADTIVADPVVESIVEVES